MVGGKKLAVRKCGESARARLALEKGFEDSRVGKRISAQASHRTVRESLPSYGSCYPIMLLFQPSNDKTTTGVRPVQICISYTNLTYHVSYRYSSSTCG